MSLPAELLSLICGNCDHPTLASLARTSRRLYTVALDSLWFELDNLAPLILCMPGDLWGVHKPYPHRWRLYFRRPIHATDWERFHFYAARVRRFGPPSVVHGPVSKYQLDDNVYAIISCAAPAALLPNLQELYWPGPVHDNSDSTYQYIKLFLSPTVRRISLALMTSDLQSCNIRLSALPALVALCPDVTSFVLRPNGSSKMAFTRRFDEGHFMTYCVPALQDITYWSSLQHLAITHFPETESVLSALAMLPALTSLKLREFIPIDRLPSSDPAEQNFTNIRQLTISSCSPDFVSRVIKMMRQAPLTSLSIVSSRNNCEDWKALFELMRDSLTFRSLETLDLICDTVYGMEMRPLALEHVAPLLVFNRLSTLSFSYSHIIDLDDRGVDAISSSLTHLEKLVLTSRKKETTPRVTVWGLASIARHCRALEHLTIAFDASTIKEESSIGIRNESITTLDVELSPIENPPLIAAFLSQMMPRLRDLKAFNPYPSSRGENVARSRNFADGWQEVRAMLAEKKKKLHARNGCVLCAVCAANCT